MSTTTNFAANFQAAKNHDYESFFKNFDNSPELIDAQKQLKKLQREVENKQHEIVELQNKRYNDDFVPALEKYCLTYSTRNYETFYFDVDTGEAISDASELQDIELSTKKGVFSYVKGYNFNLCAVLIRRVNYTINSSNTSVRFSSCKEILVPMMQQVNDRFPVKDAMITSTACGIFENALSRVDANFFVNKYFGVQVDVSKSLYAMKRCFNRNKSTEIILKTAKNNTIMNKLLDKTVEKAIPIHKIIGCSKEAWKIAEDNGIQYEFMRFKETFSSDFLSSFKKSEIEWIDFLKYAQSKEQDLIFYGIRFGENLACTLINKYIGERTWDYKGFPKYYKFGKFCNYVVDETINQGISNIDNFVELLCDYLRMCEDIGITPTLYSSYLKQTHDICSRNHKIAITQDMEDMLTCKYSDFESYIGDNYVVVAPKSCHDLQAEGDALNHCVASYITRVINNECNILFLRNKKSIERSLITVEVRDGAIVQARGIHNRDMSSAESHALREFAVARGLKFKV